MGTGRARAPASSLIDLERDGPSDPLIARELVLLRERRFQLEEQVLAQLEQIEQREAQLEQAEKDVSAAAAAWAAREPVLQSELDTLGRRLEVLQTERQALQHACPQARSPCMTTCSAAIAVPPWRRSATGSALCAAPACRQRSLTCSTPLIHWCVAHAVAGCCTPMSNEQE